MRVERLFRVESTHSLTLNETFAVAQIRTTGKGSEAASQTATSERQLRPMTERSSFTIGWPVTGCSRHLNVRATTHVNGGLWPRLCENARRMRRSKKSTLQIASYRAASNSGRVKRHRKTEYFCVLTQARSTMDNRGQRFAIISRFPSHNVKNVLQAKQVSRWPSPQASDENASVADGPVLCQ